MTKRQRVIAQEEAPISAPIESEEVKKARERIKELERWIEERKR